MEINDLDGGKLTEIVRRKEEPPGQPDSEGDPGERKRRCNHPIGNRHEPARICIFPKRHEP